MPRRTQHRATRRVTANPSTDAPGVMFLAATIVAVMISLALGLQVLFPPASTQLNKASNNNSKSILSGLKEGLVAEYYRHREMVPDEDGIWRDSSEIRIDDSGRPVWIGGGLRKDA